MDIKRISEEVQVSRRVLSRYLEYLTLLNKVYIRRIGNAKVYYLEDKLKVIPNSLILKDFYCKCGNLITEEIHENNCQIKCLKCSETYKIEVNIQVSK